MERIMRIFNTLTRQKEPLEPREEGKIGLYCCGPTVYNRAHIGNLRTYIFEDILRRTLEKAGYEVTHVMNITDVGHLTSDGDSGEDKMIKAAREQGMDVWAIAAHFTQLFHEDTLSLNILPPSIECSATAHMSHIIEFIKAIQAIGAAYLVAGNLYFDTQQDPHYGQLRGYNTQRNTMNRVEVDTNKRHNNDFVLWFSQGKFTGQAMQWDSPWGVGYPGWHIECSAMSHHYLGKEFDIHCGGVDHVAIHHTNEMAQSQAAHGCVSARYWMHGEFLTQDSTKMSKSSGDFLSLARLIELGFSPMDYRYFCFSAHYRKQLAFTEMALSGARTARLRLKEKAMGWQEALVPIDTERAHGMVDDFMDTLYDDLNMPEALAVVWNMVKDPQPSNNEKLWALQQMEEVLALNLFVKEEELQPSAHEEQEVIEVLVELRQNFRNKRDFIKADDVREQLEKMGIALKDGSDGTTWYRK